MAQTITPVVHGGSRRRWAGSVALHVLGASLSAAAMGGLLGAIGSILGAPWGIAGMLGLILLALAYAARELFGLPVPIPELRRQVPEWWRGSFGPRIAAFLYGVALGPGFGTHLRHGTFVVVAGAAIAVGDPVLGMAMLLPFGFARALGVAVASGARNERAVMAAGERLERIGSGPFPRIANAIALLGLAAAAGVVNIDDGGPASWAVSAVIAGTFGWAAAAKALRPSAWREALAVHGLPPRAERGTALLVPAAEASVAALLLAGSIRMGAALALGLLGLFSAALVRARRLRGDRLPCGCFGTRGRRSVRWLLARNAALAALALLALSRPAAIPLAAPSTEDVLPAALAIGGIALTAWLIRRGTELWPRQGSSPVRAD
jgi:hypothetical protein